MFRKIWCCLLMLILSSGFACQSLAAGISAQSAVLIEQSSGRVLYENNADEERLIASITKIMTALVAIEHGELREVYTVTAHDMAEGSSMYLQVGDQLTLEELLYGLMLVSGNDAALAVAHCVSGEVEDFVKLMNETAQALGMTHSSFANPNGLDAEGHYSSARDMARLTAHALENEVFRRIVSTDHITIGDRYLKNHNKLLDLCEGCIGVKTGFTKAAGRTLVSAATRNGMTLVCVTLKDGDDWNDHMALFDDGFATYRMETPVAGGQKLAQVMACGGTRSSVMLAAAHDLAYPIKDGEKLTVKIIAPTSVNAPISAGQVLGTVCAYLDGMEVATVDLVAMESVSIKTNEVQKGFLKNLFH
ncbi:MAG: D-alanyl-D-alanine carboxypeptidase [Oscillospiraceae bacterium]|nr:D-alanyl-D-alanine carboxypeptidase [Oscillospiraceae bacterium]